MPKKKTTIQQHAISQDFELDIQREATLLNLLDLEHLNIMFIF